MTGRPAKGRPFPGGLPGSPGKGQPRAPPGSLRAAASEPAAAGFSVTANQNMQPSMSYR